MMKRLLRAGRPERLLAVGRCLTPLAFLLLLPSSASAQSWSAEERAVIDQLQTCFDTWHEAMGKSDLGIWDRACPHEDNLIAWWPDQRPQVAARRQARVVGTGRVREAVRSRTLS